MKMVFESGASPTPPTPPSPASVGYPNDGSLSPSVPATSVGAYAFYQIFAEILGVITAAGITPDANNLGQLKAALDTRYGPSAGAVTSINGSTGAVVIPLGLAVNAVGYVAFIVVPGGTSLGTEGAVVTISGRPGSWLVAGEAYAAADSWNVAIRIA